MLEYETSPPSLDHSPSPSDQSNFASPEPALIHLAAVGITPEERSEQQPPLFKKPAPKRAEHSSLLKPDFDDNTFPLFGATPQDSGMADVAGAAASARHTSTSPRGNQTSTLTSALKQNGNGESDMMNGSASLAPPSVPVPIINHEIHHSEAGTRPISVKGKGDERSNRRESIAQSLGMGMSWGGVSVGSWIRDDMMMSGTSPFAFHQSPSYHSSSYLPKLEANFMRDFACCGMTLPTLHDLLQHYEEAHAQKDPVSTDVAQQPPMPDSRAAIAANTAAQIQQEAQQRSQDQGLLTPGSVRPFNTQNNVNKNVGFSTTLQTIPDMDTVEDMEMDDIDGGNEATPPPNVFSQGSSRASPTSQYPKQPQVPQLNTSMMQGHQAYRNSTPNTPIASARNSGAFQSGNASTTLMANPMQQFQDLQNQYRSTPDSSTPGTPGELDEALMAGMDDMSMTNNPLFGNGQNGFNGFGFGPNNDMIDLCIDEPAKRLFQPNQGNNSQFAPNRLGNGQYGPNSDIAKRIREQQMLAGLPDTTTNIAPHEEPKPFRCPVIGCEKAYKNQNGLKYHKAHGHNNQRLHENGDGTFSIVNPDTQAPYPGTMGMEKEKPYKCDVCQKRYKNLNGLKYHKTHSPPCNPDLVQNQNRPGGNPTTSSAMPSQSINMGLNMGGVSGDLSMMGT